MRLYNTQLSVKATKEEVKAWRQAAAKCNLGLQNWVRVVLDYASGNRDLYDSFVAAGKANSYRSNAIGRGVADVQSSEDSQ